VVAAGWYGGVMVHDEGAWRSENGVETGRTGGEATKFPRARTEPKPLMRRMAWWVEKRGWWPSAGQLAAELGVSRWAIFDRLRILERHGLAERKWRSWMLTADGWAYIRRLPVTARYEREPSPPAKEPRRLSAWQAFERELSARPETTD
jgi:hypothetical protein